MKKFISKYDDRTFIIDADLPGVGFYVYAYDRDGKNTHDYLQDDIDIAKRCALDEFGVPADSWTEVETANYTDLGYADTTGPKLKKLVEDMLSWMEFIHENDFFIVYWDTVTTIDPYKSFKKLADKKIGIPEHIWTQIPEDIKPKYINQRQ